MKTQFDTQITKIKSDNGFEFLNSCCLYFFPKNGVLHKKSIVGTPQQNGIVERKYKLLLDTTKAISCNQDCLSIFGEKVSCQLHILLINFPWQI